MMFNVKSLKTMKILVFVTSSFKASRDLVSRTFCGLHIVRHFIKNGSTGMRITSLSLAHPYIVQFYKGFTMILG